MTGAPRPLIVVGAGGHAREILALVDDLNAAHPAWRVLGLLVDPAHRREAQVHGLPVFAGLETLREHPGACVAIAVGDPALRLALRARLPRPELATLVHPRAWVAPRVRLGAGCQVMAGALVNTDATLGDLVVLNIGASVSHDCRLADGVTLGPGARLAGGVEVGEGAEIGMGAQVLPRLRIGEGAMVAAGAVVVRDVPPGALALGVPARLHARRPVAPAPGDDVPAPGDDAPPPHTGAPARGHSA